MTNLFLNSSENKLLFNQDNETNLSFEEMLILKDKVKSKKDYLWQHKIFKEIFVDKCYENKTVFNKIPKTNAVILDIGANVGIFTIYCNSKYNNSKIYSIEMIPETYNTLCKNVDISNMFLTDHERRKRVSVHQQNVIKPYNYAITSDETENDGFIKCTHYPQMSVLSRISDSMDEQTLKNTVIQCVNNGFRKQLKKWNIKNTMLLNLIGFIFNIIGVLLYWFLQFNSEIIKVKKSKISTIIRNEHIKKIDLLKIDVEGSEYSVLKTIDKNDWSKINNIALEIQDNQQDIVNLLKQNGFNKMELMTDEFFKNTNNIMLYASK